MLVGLDPLWVPTGERAPRPSHQDSRGPAVLDAIDLAAFLDWQIPTREWVLAPVIPEQGLVMVYSPRGIGKTYFALNIAYAVAAGGQFLRWQAPRARRVLYVDGEMPAVVMQERLAGIQASAPALPMVNHLSIITPDLQRNTIPDLGTELGQQAIERHLDGIDLLVLDNLSTLLRSGRENEAESWGPVQEWLLTLRKRGLSVLIVHHAGKGGGQRGTSRREDALDTVLALRRPDNYQAPEGARFEIHVEKGRGIHGDDAKPFEAQFSMDDGQHRWTMRDIEDVVLQRVADLLNEGFSIRDIAAELELSKSRVDRMKQKCQEAGLLQSRTAAPNCPAVPKARDRDSGTGRNPQIPGDMT